MVVSWLNLIKFAQYERVVPMKYEKIVMYLLNWLFSKYMWFPDRCLSFAVRFIYLANSKAARGQSVSAFAKIRFSNDAA